MKLARFPLGRTVVTPSALAALQETGESPGALLESHVTCAWGDVDEDDWRDNEHSLVRGCRLLSAYILSNGTRLWVITEADRSATTILLPSEY
jgi:hypothetical protein